ncbi:MAG: TolC family protein, partial [Spirochaetales bacterium]|nr:TolC family protein [Spirochaetales bacterium]
MRKVIAFLLMALSVLSLSADELSIKYDKESLYTKMLVNNTSLRNAERDIYEAHLDTKDAKANYSPDIDLTVSGTYMTEPMVGNITVSTDELLSSSGIPTSTGGYVTLFDGMDNTLYNASLTVTQPINTWGKINLAAKLYETVEGIQGMKKTDLERQLS